jgi:hypothetical protein
MALHIWSTLLAGEVAHLADADIENVAACFSGLNGP